MAEPNRTEPSTTEPAPLISTHELRALLDADPASGPAEVVLLDPRWTLMGADGWEQFTAGHVPGSRFVDLEGELSGSAGVDGRHPLPPYQLFAHAMRRVGVHEDRPVVIIDDGSTLPAARLWWMLTDAGHRDVRVLDGGFRAWVADGLSIETGPDEPAVPSEFAGHPGRRRSVDAVAIAGWICAGPERGETLVDVRAPERYAGDTEPIDDRAGHIPGAVNVPSTQNFDADGRFRPAAELRARFDGLGLDGGAVVYCGSGITACQTLLAMEVAGIDGGTLFAGSWSGWIADADRPVATGPS